MSKTIFVYVLKIYATFFAGIYAAILAVYLVVDFVDRAQIYTGPHWVHDAGLLYGYKALVAVQQLGPAVLLLGAGMAVSSLRKKGELTALRALSFGPSSIYVPVAVWATAVAFLLVGFDEFVVASAGRRVEEIQTRRFDTWGDWRFYFQPKQWFRRGDRILFLRRGDADRGFEDVTLLEVTPDFDLASRIDAAAMQHLEGTRWKLTDVVERRFRVKGNSELRRLPSLAMDLDVTKAKLRIRRGRPEQMRLWEVREQIRARRTVGLPTGEFRLALHNRFAYPLAGIPAALLAAALALRPNRRGNLTSAVVEGLAVAVVMWGTMVVGRTMVLSERLGAGPAAWAPVWAIAAAASLLWAWEEGWIGHAVAASP